MRPGTTCQIRFSDGSLSFHDTLEGAKIETQCIEDLVEKLSYTDETGACRRWIPKRITERWGAASEKRIAGLCPSYTTADKFDLFWVDQRMMPSKEVLERIDGNVDNMSEEDFANLVNFVETDFVFRG
jgi:hypothetical protein